MEQNRDPEFEQMQRELQERERLLRQEAQDRADRIHLIINSSKIPDTIKGLPSFNGETKNLTYWLGQVQTIVDVYRDLHADPIWALWMQSIRGKIVGRANDALASDNVDGEWINIRAALIEHFGDNRELSSLCQSIPYLNQGNKTLDTFYHEVTELQAKINQKINLEETYRGHTVAVSHFAASLMKEAFIDGLRNPYSAYTRNAHPRTLADAYQSAQRQFEADARKTDKFSLAKSLSGQPPDRSRNQNANVSKSNPKTANYQKQNSQNANRSASQNAYVPKNLQNNSQNNLQYANRSAVPHPAVEAMEIDPSTQSRRSAQPMSTSQRYRPAQVTSTELHEDNETADETVEQEETFFDEECGDADLNFHLAMKDLNGT